MSTGGLNRRSSPWRALQLDDDATARPVRAGPSSVRGRVSGGDVVGRRAVAFGRAEPGRLLVLDLKAGPKWRRWRCVVWVGRCWAPLIG